MKTKKQNHHSYPKIFAFLLHSVREYRKDTYLSLFFYALQACSDCTIPLMLGFMIDEMNDFQANGGDTKSILWRVVMYAIILVVLSIFSFIMALLGARSSAKAATGFAANLRKDIFYKTQDFSFENIDHFSKASLVTRQTTDITNVMFAYMMVLRNGMMAPVYFIFSIVGSIIIGASVSWIYAATVPIVAIGMTLIIYFALKSFMKAFAKYDALNKAVEENVRGIKTVKTYARENYEKNKFNKASDAIKKILSRGEMTANVSNALMNVSINISMALIVSFGSFAILRGNMLVGSFSVLINYGVLVLFALMLLAMIMVMISMSVASAQRIYEVLSEKTTVLNPDNPIEEVKDGSIEFKGVFFRYQEDAKDILKNINLKIENGQTIGIIGGTGSSKSTLVNLIPRFYDPQEGEILVGGVNIKEYDKKVLRDKVAMVLQKNILFSGTIIDNIRWGKENATLEEVEKVCKIAQADEFIQQTPGKYEAKVEQGGTNFSGGQKQRLCIARALIKSPKVLIFDDSTSAVDTKTDKNIQEGLKETLPGVTKIIIAQRISSVLHCDKIIVMDEGEISAIGTPRELYKSSPIFKEVAQLQGVSEVNVL